MARESAAPGTHRGSRVETVRAFFALWPDARAGTELGRLARDVAKRMQGRAAVDGNLHVTLAFVGDTAPSRIVDLDAIGAAAAVAVPRFRLSLDRIDAFKGAGIAWAGASVPPAELTRLAQALAEALAAAGFPTDARPFHPHVTLARKCRAPTSDALDPPIAWTVARLTLNASDLSSGPPRYRELGGWPLAVGAPAPATGTV